jgi:hypothetical protein
MFESFLNLLLSKCAKVESYAINFGRNFLKCKHKPGKSDIISCIKKTFGGVGLVLYQNEWEVRLNG